MGDITSPEETFLAPGLDYISLVHAPKAPSDFLKSFRHSSTLFCKFQDEHIAYVLSTIVLIFLEQPHYPI